MVPFQLIATTSSYGMKLVIGQSFDNTPRCLQCAVEIIIRIIHAVSAETAFKQLSSKALLCATKGKPSIRGAISLHTSGKQEHPPYPPTSSHARGSSNKYSIPVRDGSDCSNCLLSLPLYYHYANAAHAAALFVGCLKSIAAKFLIVLSCLKIP